MNVILKIAILGSLLLVTGCDYFSTRLKNLGRPPEFHSIDVTSQEHKHSQDMSALTQAHLTDSNANKNGTIENQGRNSLWKPGSRTFFRDQRARSVGDILKVRVEIQDQAKLDNKTEKKRDSRNRVGMPNFFGLEKTLKDDTSIDPSKIIGITGGNDENGSGKINRQENVNITVAATVIRILPSNNLLIKGAQEIRVNNELREITVEGIVRPEDIHSDNSITVDQIAEARVSYGGRGHLTDYQQGRFGSQLLDIFSPF